MRSILPQPIAAFVEDKPVTFVLVLLGTITLLRLIFLPLYQTALGPDEAQYWYWGQTFDWGYYSKPPMIAWVIALPTSLFGDHPWAVRLLSPILVAGTGLFLFLAGRRLYGDQVGLWAAGLWVILPVVSFGSTIISTDIPLLFFWSLGIVSLVGLADSKGSDSYTWAVLLGIAMGAGFLSKYAMVYFGVGWGLALLLSPYARKTFQFGPVVVALFIAGAIFAPNLIWNANNGFQTLSHTADNANWGQDMLNPEEMLQFVGDQFGVIGPILFATLLFGFGTIGRTLTQQNSKRDKDVFLLSFVIPPLLVITIQALLSRAHANWAMSAYPAAMILLAVWCTRWKASWILWSTTVLHGVAALILSVTLLNMTVADQMGLSNAVKRLRGWDETASQILKAAEGTDAIITDERELAAHLVWEFRDQPVELQVFDLNGRKDNTYEHVIPFSPTPQGRYLIATQNRGFICKYEEQFKSVVSAGESFVDLKAQRRGIKERTVGLYYATEYTPGLPPAC